MDKARPGSQPRIRLTEARNARGWSQHEMADNLGTTYVNVSRWERGITRPSPYFRKKLCTLFNKTEQELELDLAQDGEPTSTTASVALHQPPALSATPTHGALAANAPEALYDPLIPLPPAIFLVGRDEELARLRQRLCSGGNVALTALNGLPGVGKTALSITLAHDPEIRAHFRDGILWAGLGPDSNMQGHLSRWGTLLGMSSSEMSALDGIEAWAVALRRAIGTRMILLVIDDAWTLEDALTLKVGGPNCVHLVSTRFPSIATQIAADGAMAIKELKSDEGMVLLRMLAPQVVEKEAQRARELVMAVGGLPLALNLIGNYLRMQSYTGQARRISAALQRLSDANERLNVSEPRGPVERHPSLPSDTPVSLRTVISVTDQQLDPQTSQTLHELAVFPPRPNSFSEEAALAVTACTVEMLDLLTDTGLLESSGSDRYSLHQTIADYSRLQLTTTTAQERLVVYSMIFVEAHRKEYETLELESANILAALEMANELACSTELIRMACAFAPFLLSRGLYQLTELHIQRAYTAAQAHADYAGLAHTLLYLGEMTRKQGQYEQAEIYLQEGLGYARQIDDHDRICALLTILGTVRWKSGDYRQAETYLQEGLTLARELGYAERIGGLLEILGSVAMRQGDYRQSETYLQEALEQAKTSGEKELLCAILTNLGVMAGEQGNYDESEAYLQEGLVLARQLHNSEYISALLTNLGDVEIERGSYAQAEIYLQESLQLARQIEYREAICLLLVNLGIAARKSGDYLLATTYFQECIPLAKQINMPLITSMALYEYGNLYLYQEMPDQAEQTFQEMLRELPEGVQDWLALAQYGLARTAAAQKDFSTARELGKNSAAALEKLGHRDAPEVRRWLEALAS